MIKGIIFDMDGVISDTQKLHSRIESKLLARYGIYMTPVEITEKYSGVKTKDFFHELLKDHDPKIDLDPLLDEKWSQMEQSASQSVDMIEGSVELIRRLSSQGYPLAVASTSNMNYVQSVLRTLGIIDRFSFIASGDMVLKGKPDPEIFLLAASKIHVDPKKCLVIEDGISGMKAAKSANMKCIGLVSDKNKNYPTKNLVTSLAEITPEYLNQIV